MKPIRQIINYLLSIKMLFLKYLISGSLAAASGFLILYLLTDILRVWYILSSIASFVITFLVSFSLQKLWTFQNNDFVLVYSQLTNSLAYALFILILNVVLMYFFVDILRIYYMISQFVCYIIFAFMGFFVYKLFIFRK